MQHPGADSVLGDFDDASFSHGGVETRFFRRDDAYWVSTEGPDGGQSEYPVAATFGADPLQQYLIEFPGGRLQALDIAWDTRPAEAGGQRWFHLQPGQRYEAGDPMHWTGIAFTWNHMCAECHSTDLRKNYDAATDTYATTYSEVNVSCEACHGPSSVHVAWAENREAGPGSAAAVSAGEPGVSARQMGLQVDFPAIADHSWDIDEETGLARRRPEQAPAYDVEVCGRCHARRGVFDEDYRHGGAVTDFYRVALLEQGLYHDDGQILDEVFVYGSFLQSRMYQKGVACSDCHDPHGLEPYNDGNALCSRCHLAARFDTPAHHHHETGAPGASCIDCHMPATTYMVVDPRRDHSFRPPRPDMSVAYGTPNACAACHTDEGDRWLADAVETWFGAERPASYGELLASGRGNSADAALDLRRLAADLEAPGIMRATALSALPATSQGTLSVVVSALGDADPLVRVGALMALETADPTTLSRLVPPLLADENRAVRLEAARLMATIPPQQVAPGQRAAVEAALDEYRDAQLASADRAQAHLNLGWLALQRGDVSTAEREYQTAMRLEPMFMPTFINLADLYRLTGRDAEGEALLLRALEITPESGDVHYALGLQMVRADRLQDAVGMLRRAAELAPENPHYLYVHAVAVQTSGDTDGALEILDRGLARFPADRELLFGAAAFSRDSGDLQRAIEYARRLVALEPGDAQAAAFLRELEGRQNDNDQRDR